MNELQSVTDIDEVIKYAEREAEGCHQMASAYHTDEGVYLHEETRFMYKAILWENIHEWLEELKELRKKQIPHGEWLISPDKTRACCPFCHHKWTDADEIALLDTAFRAKNFCEYCGADMRKEGEANEN